MFFPLGLSIFWVASWFSFDKGQSIFQHAKILRKAQKLKNSTPLKIVVLNNSISPKHQQAVAKVSKYGVTRLAKTFQKLT